MKQTRILMDMPVTIEIVDAGVDSSIVNKIYDYFSYVDDTFSTFKKTSEVSKINRGEIKAGAYSDGMGEVLRLCEETKKETAGYFDIQKGDKIDPSGLVKGWAIYHAAQILRKAGFLNYCVEAGGDIQTAGLNTAQTKWRIGIRNPLNIAEIVKVVRVSGEGVATSGTYERGQHIYNPQQPNQKITEIVSLTVVGPNIYEADRFATAAFAMEKAGIVFLEHLPGFEAYMIDKRGVATMTSGFERFTKE